CDPGFNPNPAGAYASPGFDQPGMPGGFAGGGYGGCGGGCGGCGGGCSGCGGCGGGGGDFNKGGNVPGTKLYVGNLPGDIQRQALDVVFKTYGEVTDIHIMTG
ncbi:sol, partial [Symbiodinium pilosum]